MRTIWSVFIFVAIGCHLLTAQSSGSISGRIFDAADNSEREPLRFATISLKNTTITEQTDFYGNFGILGVQPGNYMITIGYLGYEPKERPVRVKANEITYIEEQLKPLSSDSSLLVISEGTSGAQKVALKEVKENRP